MNLSYLTKKLQSKSDHPMIQLWNSNKKWRTQGIIAGTFSVLYKIFDIAPEILIGIAVDTVVKRQDSYLGRFVQSDNYLTLIICLGIITVIVWGLESFFEYLQKISWRQLAQKVQHKVRIQAFVQTLNNPLGMV